MDKKINLIPEELTVPPSVVKLTKVINKFSIIAVISLILTSLAMISIFIYFSINLKNLDSSNSILKETVISLEKTEQQLALTKDKLSKIILVKSLDSADTNFENYKEFKTIVTEFPDMSLGETEITPKGMEVSVSSNNTSSFIDFLKKISEFNKFPNASIQSLNFRPEKGLMLNLTYGI